MKQKKISKYLFVIYMCVCSLAFDSYSQVTIDFNNAKIMKWSSVRREKKEDIRYRRMTKTIKYIFINTSDYSDSFKLFIGGKKMTDLREIKGNYTDFEYLAKTQQMPLVNYTLDVNYNDVKSKYIYIYIYNKFKILRLRVYENFHFIYIYEDDGKWELTYSNNNHFY